MMQLGQSQPSPYDLYAGIESGRLQAQQQLQREMRQKEILSETTKWVTIGGSAVLVVLFIMVSNKKAKSR